MSKEVIVERILSDAEAEAQAILSEAQKRADEVIASANARAEQRRAETEAEVLERAKRIAEGIAAAARLDSQKVLLSEKRRALDSVYACALNALLKLGEKESLALFTRLLAENAEAGDEIVFAENFAYAEKAATLSIIKEKKLTVSKERAKLDGGFLLRGEKCDKDLSFGVLLKADADSHLAALAEKLFR